MLNSMADAMTDDLIPRDLLLRNPTRASYSISPDGEYLAFLADVSGQLTIWVGPRDGSAPPQRVSPPANASITQFSWAYTSRHILFLRDDTGRENWYVQSVDVLTGEAFSLTPTNGASARIVSLSHRHPDRVLVAVNLRNAAIHDLCEVGVTGGELAMKEENPGFAGYVVDTDYRVHIAYRLLADGACEYLTRDSEGNWRPLFSIPFEDQMTTRIEWIDARHGWLYLRDSRNRNTSGLVRLDMADGSLTTLAESENADLVTVLVKPADDALQAVSFEYDRLRWQFFDVETEKVFARLEKDSPGNITILNRSIDDRFWVTCGSGDAAPGRFYLYDRKQESCEFLAENFDFLHGQPLSPMHSIRIRSRDGLELMTYMQLPRWTDPAGTGRPDRPMPAVILVHGGPWARDHWGLNPSTQWLANRGYVTLSVNFRGSSGFGKRFLNAGNREWGAKMQDDLLDVAAWAVENGIAGEDRLAVMGSSYGGYAALATLALGPADRFACAVDLSGPANLVSFLESAPAYWKPIQDMLAARVGDYRTEEGREFLLSRSPLTHAGRIRRPVLIVHGENDARVPRRESDQIAEVLHTAGIPVVYVVFSDEGHVISKPANAQAFAAMAESFLSRFLGGRAEPPAEAIARSSAQIIYGREWID